MKPASTCTGAMPACRTGGVNLYLHPSTFRLLSDARMMASDGRNKTFAANGDGFVPGEGVGVVILKPLALAEQRGDSIHALINASSINHGGKTSGYTVPNPTAQADVVRQALAKVA